MKIKVVVDKSNKEEWTYAVYHGFARPFIIPFYTKWILDRKGMTAEELGKYFSFYKITARKMRGLQPRL